MSRRIDDDLKAYLASAPPRAPLDTLERIETRAAQPWYRRAWSWLVDAHKIAAFITAVCVGSVAAHAYIAGLITKDNLKTEVTQAVREAMLDTNGRVSDLEDHTADLPNWRTTTHEMVARHDERIHLVETRQDKLESRFDRYLRR